MIESAVALSRRILAGETSAAAVCRETFARIDAGDSRLHAFQSLMRDRAMARAESIDRDPARFHGSPIAGVPVALKDNLATRGHLTTAGSRLLATFAPPYDAHVVERLDAAGALLVGKTTLDEFAMGSSTEHSAFGPARNPWDDARVSGGSSGGSAAAVGAGFTPLALGSDTGGSIRQPAAFCGVAGLRPTYGRVSRHGLFAFASSLDQIGPIARRVRDVAALLSVIAGPDARDATSAAAPPFAWDPSAARARGARIGVPRASLAGGVETGVLDAFERALDTLRGEGAEIVEVALPSSSAAIAAYYVIATAEASSNLARFDGVRYGAREAGATLDEMYGRTRTRGFGAEVKRRLMLGTYALSAGYYEAYYLKALKVRDVIAREFARAFAGADMIAMPTTPTPAFRLGARLEDPLQMYLADVFTVGASLAGLPAISVPCGFAQADDDAGARLPVGLQLIGKPWDESGVLSAAEVYERASGWVSEKPGARA